MCVADPTAVALSGVVIPQVEPSADAAGLLRVFMKHSRLADAASLAITRLKDLTRVPSMTLRSPAAVCLPQQLIDTLCQQLGTAGGPEPARLLHELHSAVQREREAAAAQTVGVEHVFF